MNRTSESAGKSFVMGQGQTVSKLDGWLKTQDRQLFLNGKLQQTKKSARISIQVSTRSEGQGSNEVLRLAMLRALDSDEGLPHDPALRLALTHLVLSDNETPLTVEELSKKTGPYAEAEKKRVSKRNEYSRIFEDNEKTIRKKIGTSGFLVMRKLFANLPEGFDRMVSKRELRAVLDDAVTAMNWQVELPILLDTSLAFLANQKNFLEYEFPITTRLVLECVVMIQQDDLGAVSKKIAAISALHHDYNHPRTHGSDAIASSSGLRQTPAKSRNPERKATSTDLEKPKSRELPTLSPVKRSEAGAGEVRMTREEKKQRRRQAGLSMPSAPAKAQREDRISNSTGQGHTGKSAKRLASRHGDYDDSVMRKPAPKEKRPAAAGADKVLPPSSTRTAAADLTADSTTPRSEPPASVRYFPRSNQPKVEMADLHRFQTGQHRRGKSEGGSVGDSQH